MNDLLKFYFFQGYRLPEQAEQRVLHVARATNLCMVKQVVNSHHFIVPDVGKFA